MIWLLKLTLVTLFLVDLWLLLDIVGLGYVGVLAIAAFVLMTHSKLERTEGVGAE